MALMIQATMQRSTRILVSPDLCFLSHCDTSEGQNACPSQAPRRYTIAVMMAVMKIQRSWNQ